MANYIEGLQIVANLWQKGLDNLRKNPWIVFLLLAIVWGSAGWYLEIQESKEHKKDNKAHEAVKDAMANTVIDAQLKTIHAQEKTIHILESRDTTKK